MSWLISGGLKTTWAEGGDDIFNITVDGVTYRVHKFTTVGTSELVVLKGGEFEYLVVAGGGGGGASFASTPRFAGGGGAGGLLKGTINLSIDVYSVAVGAGGNGASSINSAGQNGFDSEFATIQAVGGGGGQSTNTNNNNAQNGGSGGGGGFHPDQRTGFGASGILGQGNNGGDEDSGIPASGGGGGATAEGGNIDGGAGLTSDFTGVAVVYAQGGNGAVGTGNVRGDNAAVVGGGGGGGKNGGNGGNGGSGIVIVRYAIA